MSNSNWDFTVKYIVQLAPMFTIIGSYTHISVLGSSLDADTASYTLSGFGPRSSRPSRNDSVPTGAQRGRQKERQQV